nr:hypothetical protein BaRGS_003371 [Batillaria attramentaria]
MFQTIRSSGQYLFLDVDLTGFGHSVVDVEFTVTSSLKAVMPRVMYAGFADSYVWMDLDAPEGLGFLLRGTDDNPENYTTCIHLSVLETPQSVPSHNLSDFMYAYSVVKEMEIEFYTSNLDCRWRITADYGVVKLKLLFVSISQQSQSCAGHDFLVIYDDQYQCNKDIYVSAGDFQYITSPNHPDPYPRLLPV